MSSDEEVGVVSRYGADRLPEDRLVEQPRCRECGCQLGAGYLCDDCDSIEVNA